MRQKEIRESAMLASVLLPSSANTRSDASASSSYLRINWIEKSGIETNTTASLDLIKTVTIQSGWDRDRAVQYIPLLSTSALFGVRMTPWLNYSLLKLLRKRWLQVRGTRGGTNWSRSAEGTKAKSRP
jgi:hypothetical protein